MHKLFGVATAAAFVLGASTASAGVFPVTATLEIAIGDLPAASFAGAAPAASSAGAGGAATLPAGAISGVFASPISPPLLGLLDGLAIGAPGGWPGGPAVNTPLDFDGTEGFMPLSASAYLLMGGAPVAELPIAVIGGPIPTQMTHILTLVAGIITPNPYQLGMVTLMGALNTAPHTLMGTGFDARTAGGAGTLVLVSPTNIQLGLLGNLASVATLTMNFGTVPEPGTLLLLGIGAAALAARARRPR